MLNCTRRAGDSIFQVSMLVKAFILYESYYAVVTFNQYKCFL